MTLCSAPPEFDAPTFYRVVSDARLVVVLYPASPENGDITHYYVVVVADQLTHGRRPGDFKLDEVPASSRHRRLAGALIHCVLCV